MDVGRQPNLPVLDEAQREGVPLSDVERRMRYFSEVNGEPEDLVDLNDEFERTCDTDEYEKKRSAA